LSEHFSDVKVSVDVFGYNSKVFYLITEGAGFGDQVIRLPITGNDTVLDAVASIGGLSQVAGSKIWISRPAPHGVGCDQVLPVDWEAITTAANTCTNYQIMPGDRLFVSQDRIFALGSLLGRLLNPIERIFGFGLLGSQAINSTNNLGLFN
jgi:protein involved in polysaccharide export with SLBB domain